MHGESYDHVTPTTDPGRIFTVFFGLIGIPLMFITAADIGKFLSEIVIRTYAKLLQFWHFVSTIVELLQTNLCDGDVDSMDSLVTKTATDMREFSVVDATPERDVWEKVGLLTKSVDSHQATV
ncbi:unnamed protein product [Haemonchus placei]|uniref:Ion_trans_2 domain-containing protein n=1 Tax=Haemonchus placei TaxID=6290 RepID=A0A0N4W4I7_HAEPC|nr:unnamed protein product [Haemonchus placei]